MLKHYLKIAFRSLWNEKVYLVINIIGLTIAIACCFLFIFWIRFELSFEDCYPEADRIFQVQEAEIRADGVHKQMELFPTVHEQLKKDYPFTEESIYIMHQNNSYDMENGESVMMNVLSSPPAFFKLFPLKCIVGNINETIKKEKGIFISEKTAIQYFGSPVSAIGKTFTGFPGSDFVQNYTVDGVVSIPENTHIRFDLLVIEKENPILQYATSAHYILVKKNSKLKDTNNFLTEKQQQQLARSLSKMESSKYAYVFQPIKKIHLYTDKYTEKIQYGDIYYGDIKQIRILAIVVLLILILAIINYVNTSTAKAISRAKEVGIRKVTGSLRFQLVTRFLTESFIISLVAVILAIDVAKIFHPLFINVIGNEFPFGFNISTLSAAAIICIITSLFSGGYAAFYLSAFDPVKVLKGVSQTGSKEYLRKVLLGIQFTLSIIILVCTSVIYRQLDYIFSKDLGFDRSNVYKLDTNLCYEAETLIQELCKNPNIVNAGMASREPFNVEWGYTGVEWAGSTDAVKEITFANLYCDYRFASVFGLQVVKGEFIQPGYTWWQWTEEKSYSIVINETFEKLLGMENAVGNSVTYFPLGKHYPVTGKIIGVVKDFHFKPLQNDISPLIISFNPEGCDRMFIKIRPDNRRQTIQYIKEKYDAFKEEGVLQKNRPFMLTSLDTIYNQMYTNEVRLERFLVLFSILSIVLSCMGIFGMTIFVIEKRTKEIALRKINGASVKDILLLFGKEFAQLIALASLIALPVAFLLMHQWTEQYIYKTSMGWWLFILIPLCILIITSATVIMQIYNAARKNPVDSLRSE